MDGWMLKPSLNQCPKRTQRAEEASSDQQPPPQTTEESKHRPRVSFLPEYSTEVSHRGSALPSSTYSTESYAEKKSRQKKQEEVEEVKRLDEWKPAADIFAVLDEHSSASVRCK
ncbi:uncharacterized protein V6R79_020943 [Siganus canaliculatus]